MLEILFTSLCPASVSAVKVVVHFQFAVFCLLVHMCFGVKLEESKVRDIQAIQRQLLVSFVRFQIL